MAYSSGYHNEPSNSVKNMALRDRLSGRVIAQMVVRRLPTAAAGFGPGGGFWWTECTGEGFLPILTPPSAPYSLMTLSSTLYSPGYWQHR